jgi:transposase
MTARAYVDKILEPVVKPWLQERNHFVLEEDRDSGHGISVKLTPATKLVKDWKEANSLTSFFNCSGSPDLSPIEDCWQPTKQYIRKFPHWQKQDTIRLATEGWERIEQDWINKKIDEIPDRLHAVIQHHGKASGY